MAESGDALASCRRTQSVVGAQEAPPLGSLGSSVAEGAEPAACTRRRRAPRPTRCTACLRRTRRCGRSFGAVFARRPPGSESAHGGHRCMRGRRTDRDIEQRARHGSAPALDVTMWRDVARAGSMVGDRTGGVVSVVMERTVYVSAPGSGGVDVAAGLAQGMRGSAGRRCCKPPPRAAGRAASGVSSASGRCNRSEFAWCGRVGTGACNCERRGRLA